MFLLKIKLFSFLRHGYVKHVLQWMVSSRINPFSHPGMRCKSFTAGFVSEYRCNTSGLSNPCPSVMHRMPSIVIKCPSLSTKLYISLHRPCIGTLCTTVAPGAVHEGTQVSSTLIGGHEQGPEGSLDAREVPRELQSGAHSANNDEAAFHDVTLS